MQHFKLLVLIAVIATIVVGYPEDFTAKNEKKVVCYFGSWSVYRPGKGKFDIDKIDPSLCTHLIYAFIGLSGKDNVKSLDEWADLPSGLNGFGKFNALRKKYPQLKTLVAIGGWNGKSVPYSNLAKDPAARERFADNALAFVKKYQFDGLDVDWEYPAQRGGDKADKQNFPLLLKALKTRFEKHGLLLTVAVAATEKSASQSYDIPAISKYVDFIHLMTYDFYGWENQTGHHSSLYNDKGFSVMSSISYWLSQGAPKEKLIVGIPTYGRTFTLADSSLNEIGAAALGKGLPGPYTHENGFLGYNEFCEKFLEGGWEIKQDPKGVYGFKGNQWVGYDNSPTVMEKAEFIKSMDLGGAMIWSIETEDFRGICGMEYPLLNAINSVFRDEKSIMKNKSTPEQIPPLNEENDNKLFLDTNGIVDEPNPLDLGFPPDIFEELNDDEDNDVHNNVDNEDNDVHNNVDNEDNDVSYISSPTTLPMNIVKQCQEKDLIALPGSCDFVQCQVNPLGGFITYVKECPAGLCFDGTICNWQ